MKVATLGILLVCFVDFTSAVDEDYAWNEFKSQYNKSYETEAEEVSRRKVFLNNLRYIEEQNAVSRSDERSFTEGVNNLADLTTEEIIQTRCGFRLEDSESEFKPIEGLLETLLLAFNTSSLNNKAWYDRFLIPEELDYRSKNLVTPVKDQLSCGSCWSFATVGALESILAKDNKNILLSEQNLVDCSRSYGNNGCSGGLMDAALRYVRDHGIMSSADYPYAGRNGRCRFVETKSVMNVRGSVVLPRGNEAVLRIALALTGPIPVAIDASPRSFQFYSSGIYNDRSCRSSSRTLNHAALLVGYGTNKYHGDYWIVKNSWGIKWGDNGYIKMARNKDNLCGIASYAVLPLP